MLLVCNQTCHNLNISQRRISERKRRDSREFLPLQNCQQASTLWCGNWGRTFRPNNCLRITSKKLKWTLENLSRGQQECQLCTKRKFLLSITIFWPSSTGCFLNTVTHNRQVFQCNRATTTQHMLTRTLF